MGDIAFLLLIFFMATTIFKTEDGIEVDLPRSESGENQKREGVLHVWIDHKGRVWINDRFVADDELQAIVTREAGARPGLVVAFNADVQAPYRSVAAVLDKLKGSGALHVSFTSEPSRKAAISTD
jgi:biopolymer transport protein ExbD